MRGQRWMMMAALGMALAGAAQAEGDAARLDELERQARVLAEEIEKLKLQDVAIEPGERAYGLSPSASKVYFKDQGVSLGGYGEALYQNFDDKDKTDEWDFLRMILYAGYKYNDKLVLNTELEVEHAADDKEGEVAVEFAYLDYLWRPEVNLRGGLLLVPVGLMSEYHEPTTFLSARRPDTEQRIIPSTWRENGVGVFGDVAGFSYKAYLMNGFDGEEFTAAGLRGGRQKGSKAEAEDLAGVARLDYTAVDGLVIGASTYYGDSGQDLPFSLQTLIYEAHLDWAWKGLEVRALAAGRGGGRRERAQQLPAGQLRRSAGHHRPRSRRRRNAGLVHPGRLRPLHGAAPRRSLADALRALRGTGHAGQGPRGLHRFGQKRHGYPDRGLELQTHPGDCAEG
jgi:hypothetical protein